ncbi:hypothetical protein P2318_04935 [Myxococcaceae bacterium GXIMD 01537]
MARTKNPREGYGSTSEQRQRGLSGDSFSERAPQTPEEAEAARATPDIEHRVVRVEPAAPLGEEEPDGT